MDLNAATEVAVGPRAVGVQAPQGTFRYFLIYYAIVLILLVSGYLLVNYFESEKLRSATLAVEMDHIELVTKSLARELEIVGSDFKSLTKGTHLADFLNKGDEASKDKLTERLLSFLTDRRTYDQARLINNLGMEVLRVNYNGGVSSVVPAHQLQNKSLRQYITDVMALPPGSLYVSPLDLNMENGEVEVPYKPIIRIATPLTDASGTYQGILIVNYLAQAMFDQFYRQLPGDEIGKDEYSVINQDGFWLHNPDVSKEWGFVLGSNDTFGTQFPKVWPQIFSRQSGQVETELGLFTFATIYPASHVSAGSLLPAHDVVETDTSWSLELRQPQFFWKVVSHVHGPRMGLDSIGAENTPSLSVLAALLVFSVFGSWQVAKACAVKKETEAALRVLSQAVEQNPSMVLITNKDGGIEYVNLRFCRNTGYEKSEVIGHNPKILNADNMTVDDYCNMWKDITQGKNWAGDMHDQRKDGSYYWASSHIAPIRDDNGEITHFVGMQEDITDEKALREELQRLATTDALTGIFNRRHFYDLVDTEVQRSRRYQCPLTVMMMDLDYFKSINDRYGHMGGDACLLAFVKLVGGALRTTDIFARFGGEEFIIALSDTPLDAAINLAERLREQVTELDVDHEGVSIKFSVSIGVSEWHEGEDSLEPTINRGDKALYQAKEKGRNKVEII